MRTAKACGPDVAVLASSCAKARALCDDGGKRAVLRGDHVISRKAIAQGMPECSDCTCMLVCVTPRALLHTRPRVQQAPGIPCALLIFSGAKDWQSSGETRRENAEVCLIIVADPSLLPSKSDVSDFDHN